MPAAPAADSPSATGGTSAQSAPTAAGSQADASAAPKPPKNGDTRKVELQREIDDLLKQRAALRRDVSAAPTAPADQSSAEPRAAARATAGDGADPRPDPADAIKYPDGLYDGRYLEDIARWGARQEARERDRETQARQAEEARTQASRERNTRLSERIAAARTADPAFLDKLSPDVMALRPLDALGQGEPVGALNALATEVFDSEVAADLLLHFSEHSDDLSRFARMVPRELVREFGRLEDRFLDARKKATASAAEALVTKAPPPVPPLDGKSSTPSDPIRGAVARRDFAAFREAKQAQLLAARR